jgi:creatinine amidohydrolase/Fe(II)-dependent formamide hydrolase-like protein
MNTPSPATIRHIVRQSCAIHPTWNLGMHLHYLEVEEMIDLDTQTFILVKDTYEKAKRS